MRLLRGYMTVAEVFELVNCVPSVFINGAGVVVAYAKTKAGPPPLVAHISNPYFGVGRYVRPIDSSLRFWLN
jgi:hypothetical protein